MEYRPFENKLESATDIKNVNLLTKMDVYAVVSIKGDPYSAQKQKTHVDKDCGTNPKWNSTMKFTIDESSLQSNRLTLKIQLKSDRAFGDKEIGEILVPIKELFDQDPTEQKKTTHDVKYGVRLPNGKTKGTVHFSFKFAEKYSAPATAHPPVTEKKKADEPMMAYPVSGYPNVAGSSSGGYYQQPPPPPPPPHVHDGKGQAPQPYPYPPYSYPNAYPAAAPGGYPPPPYYGGYPTSGYGNQGYGQPGYGGYGGVAPPQKPKKSGVGKMGLGLGAGLLGGLLIGDMISDAGDIASYDAGYDAGFDDAGGFDF